MNKTELRSDVLALLNVFRTRDWHKDYEPIDLTTKIIKQILDGQQGQTNYLPSYF